MRIFSVNNYNDTKYQSNYIQKGVAFRSRDLLDLPEKDIFEKVDSSITPENFLGQGTEAEVYRISDTDYCVRIPHQTAELYRSKYSKELTPVDKINHVAARLGHGATILRYFDGVVPKEYQHNEYGRYKLQADIAEMPIKSYSELLHQIAEAIDNELVFDFSGGNLIVDKKKQKLTAIDFYGITDDPRPIRPLSEMYSVLTCYGAQKKTGKNIFDKIIDTALEEFKPKKIPCMDTSLFDFLEVCLKRMGDAYTSGGEKFKSVIMHNCSVLEKLKKSEIFDKSVSKLLEQQILTVRKLLKKVC